MVHPSVIEARIGKLGFRHSRWFRAEIHELQHILMDDEEIIVLACGRYFGSFALLVATDQRLLLIDKRVFFMTIEDTRYDMISEIDYNSQVYNATVTIFTINKTHKFSSIRFKKELRELTTYVQRRVMEFRQQKPMDMPRVPDNEQFTPRHAAMAQAPENYVIPQPNNTITQPDSTPAPISSLPTDYYVDDSNDAHRLRARVSHAAHLVGTAATHAAHRQPGLDARPFHPYIQGSLMTRRPIIS